MTIGRAANILIVTTVLLFMALPILVIAVLSFSSASYLTFPPPAFGVRWYRDYLGSAEWLALDHPTIADIACFPYIALGHEGRAPIGDRPGVLAWTQRIKALPGFVGMPAI